MDRLPGLRHDGICIIMKDLLYIPQFYAPDAAQELYERLLKELPWESGTIRMFGKTVAIPRLQVFFAENGLSYAYSNQQLTTCPFPEIIQKIRQKAEVQCGEDFNSCLANLYRNGQDGNGWHADNEPELGPEPVIASVSFGEVRKFRLRHNETREIIHFELEPGSLLYMGKSIQREWKHEVPKTKTEKQARINLTFRKIIR